ncbi:MAG: hypothetical protein AB7F88_09335 [Pyrinomonadaceae bacterium]
MKRELALQLLRNIIPESDLDEDKFQRIFAELGILAEQKYDRYEMYQPGRLFFENLYAWLLKFDEPERIAALNFIRDRLIYVSRQEFEQLTQILYNDRIRQAQIDLVSSRTGIPRFKIRQLTEHPEMKRIQRSSLYVGMSDGSRIDYLRRQNLEITNEQVLPSYDQSAEKIGDILKELQKEYGSDAQFECLFLIDDFCASGKTFLREVVSDTLAASIELVIPEALKSLIKYDAETRKIKLNYREGGISETEISTLKGLSEAPEYVAALETLLERHSHREVEVAGSLPRLSERGLFGILSATATVYFCPLLITEYAQVRIEQISKRSPVCGAHSLRILPSARIPDSARIRETDLGSNPIAGICDKYYDEAIEDEHTGNVKYGYADCGLPVVLHHNTPNNSLFILWSRKWVNPLFVRYERHGR